MPSNNRRPAVGSIPVSAVVVVVLTDLAVLAVGGDVAADGGVRVGLGIGAVLATLVGVAVGSRRGRAALGGWLLAVPVALLYAYTGMVLPWNGASFALAQVGVELALSLPSPVGRALARLLFAGYTLSQATLERMFLLHYGVAAVAVVGVVLRVGVGYVVGDRASAA